MSRSIVHKIDGKNRLMEIRWSTDEDIQKIYEWLQEEEKQRVLGNFLCNWNLTKRCHREGNLLVLFDKTDGIPIGYQWGQLLQSGVLQIRNAWRGNRLGRLLVEHCIDLALEQDEMVLRIECKPSSSIPFWKTMGFTILEDQYGRNAKRYKILTKLLVLPQKGTEVEVRISIFPEDRKWNEDITPIATFTPQAVRRPGGEIMLAERVAFLDRCSDLSDPVVEIVVEKRLAYRDKVKYEKAQQCGVRQCRNGFFIDWVALP